MPLVTGELVDFHSGINETLLFLECCEKFWSGHAQFGGAKTFKGIVHSFLLSQSYTHLFEKFIFQYMVVDACYKLTEICSSKELHVRPYKRISWLSEKYNLNLPSWASIIKKEGSKGTTSIAKIRNVLVHEGLWGGEAIGFAPLPEEENIVRELVGFNARLIASMLGYIGQYSESRCQTRSNFLFHGRYNPRFALCNNWS